MVFNGYAFVPGLVSDPLNETYNGLLGIMPPAIPEEDEDEDDEDEEEDDEEDEEDDADKDKDELDPVISEDRDSLKTLKQSHPADKIKTARMGKVNLK
jgi:hypothetical protein